MYNKSERHRKTEVLFCYDVRSDPTTTEEKLTAIADERAFTLEPSGRFLTKSQLSSQSARFAHALRFLGIAPDEDASVAWLLENRLEVAVIAVGAHRGGYRYLALNTHCTPEETAGILATLKPRALVVSSTQLRRPGMSEALAGLGTEIHRILIGAEEEGEPGDWIPFTPLMFSCPDTWNDVEANTPGKALLLSGGSSGRPKVIVHDDDQGIGSDDDLDGLFPGPGEAMFVPEALYHTAPGTILVQTLLRGGHVIGMDKWDVETAFAAIEQYGVTHSFLVPDLMSRMLQYGGRHERNISSLKLVIHGASPCPVSVKHAWLDWTEPFGCVTVELYSMSEYLGKTACSGDEWRARPGTVGKALGCRIIIRDDEGNELPIGEVGTIWFAGGKTMQYLDDPEETAASYAIRNGEREGTVQDLGYVDEDGYLFMAGRKKDMIIVNGVNIYPARVDNVLRSHPSVADAAATGVITGQDEWIVALVELREETAPGEALTDELTALCREELGTLSTPRTIVFASVPRLDTGKVRKQEVRALLGV